MPKNNVYSNAKVLKDSSSEVSSYQLGNFGGVSNEAPVGERNIETIVNAPQQQNSVDSDIIVSELQKLQSQLNLIQNKVTTIETTGVQSKDIDKQVIKAIDDLKHYASFFEQAAFQMESKLLKTSVSIAQKIIGIEVSSNSAEIAKATINSLLEKVKTASKVTIHLNPKDYVLLKHELNLSNTIELQEDLNVMAGGVVIASDLGNFDGNIEAKVKSMLESFDLLN